MLKYLLLAALVPACVFGLNFDACPGNAPVPTSVSVVGCALQPCTIVNGQLIQFTATFNNPLPTASIHPEIIGLLGIIQVPLPLPPDFQNGCNFLTGGGSCPLSGGENLTADVSLPIDLPIAGVSVTVQFRLLDASNNVILCIRFAANLVN